MSDFYAKIVILGDGGVGKTRLRQRYMGASFKASYQQTMGADLSHYSEDTEKGKISWMIWDLAGQPNYKQVRSMIYVGSHGGLVCFDVTRRDTFENINGWITELINHTGNIPIIIVTTKIDLDNHVIADEEVKIAKEKLLEKFNHAFSIYTIKTSALTGENIKQTFDILRDQII